MKENTVTIQGEFPPEHPLADTHRYAFDLGPAFKKGDSLAWPIQDVRAELIEAAEQQLKAAEALNAAAERLKETP